MKLCILLRNYKLTYKAFYTSLRKNVRDEEGGAAGRNFQTSVQCGVQRSVQRGFTVRRTSAAQVLVPLALWVPREQTGECMQEQPREQPQEQPRELFIRIRGTRCRRSWCSAPAFLWDALTATCACTSTELQRARARVPWRRMEGVCWTRKGVRGRGRREIVRLESIHTPCIVSRTR